VSGFLAALSVSAASASTATAQAPLKISEVREGLVREGYQVRERCGQVSDPSSMIQSSSRPVRLRSFPACSLIIERSGYSVSLVPYRSAAAARLAYQNTANPWARSIREAVVGHVVLRAFRLPQRDWARISRAVRLALAGVHP
jgi:hypothetical protein